MTSMQPLLLLFGLTWLMAALWLALMARLLQQLHRHDPEAYAALGSPVMRWLWWCWPTPQQGLPPFISLTGLSQRRLELSTRYSPAEIGSIMRLLLWVLRDRPRLSVSRASLRLQAQLRLSALGFVLGFAGLLLMAVSVARR